MSAAPIILVPGFWLGGCWPMWSRPRELAEIIGDVAEAHVREA